MRNFSFKKGGGNILPLRNTVLYPLGLQRETNTGLALPELASTQYSSQCLERREKVTHQLF